MTIENDILSGLTPCVTGLESYNFDNFEEFCVFLNKASTQEPIDNLELQKNLLAEMQNLTDDKKKAIADAFNPAGQVYKDICQDLNEFKRRDGEDDVVFEARKNSLFEDNVLLGLVFYFKSKAPYELLTPVLKDAVDQKIQDNARRFVASIKQSTDARLCELVKTYNGAGEPFRKYQQFQLTFVQKTLDERSALH